MKKVLFVALCAMFCLGSAAQNDEFKEVTDSVATGEDTNSIPVDQNSMLGMVQGYSPIGLDAAPINEKLTYPLGKGLFKKHHIEHALELCPSISKSKVSQSELLSGENIDEITDTGFGLNFGYSVIFVPGYEKNGKLHPNKFGIAYSVGLITSFSVSDRYGTLCDFMGKIGVEACHNHRMGIGMDFLVGYGKSAGDVFWYNNIVEDPAPTSVSPYAMWGKKFGGQIWIKTGLLGKTFSKTDVLLFARLVKAIDPGEISKASMNHRNLWREENWSFGVILRYRM